jgi:hypothetical protein
MSFWKAVSSIVKNLEKTFEKNADKAVNDPDDGRQADRDAWKVGEDTRSTARDAANDEVKNHDPAWKGIKDLSDKVIDAVPKVEAAAKYRWLKFVGVVTAIFTGAIFFASTQTPSISPEQQAARDVIRHAEETKRQIEYLNQIMLSEDDWNIMMGGLEVQSPTPVNTPAAVPAEAAPLPPIIAAAAAEPMTVEVTTPNGTREFTTTVENVYRQAPDRVRQVMTQAPPPPKIDHGYDHENPNDCYHTHCLGGDISKAGGFHKDFTVTAVDGNGNTFGSARIHN